MTARRLPRRVRVASGVIVLAMAAIGCGGPPPSASPAGTVGVPTAPTASPGLVSASPVPSSTPYVATPLGATGAIVLLETDSTYSVIDAASGARTRLDSAVAGAVGFAAWSPDASRIATIADDGTASIRVYDVAEAIETGGSQVPEPDPIEPTVLFENPEIAPFYLSWSPDGDTISYLASVASGIALRLVPADGSAPRDGSDPGAIVGAGSPLYYDWIGSDRMLAHVGTGPAALLGEIDLGGELVGPPLGPPGTFRAAVVSADQQRVAFIRQDAAGDLAVVVSDRDGADGLAIPVFGQAAMAFHPFTSSLATIGPVAAMETAVGFPLGPLRLMEDGATEVRLLLEGAVVGFWWSPDGATIAALRVQEPELPVPGRTSEVRLLFIDVASGEVTAQSVVELGPLFVDQFIGFFDQYALSHELWAPDSSAFLLPVVDGDGGTRVAVMYPDGRAPLLLPGLAAFWSP